MTYTVRRFEDGRFHHSGHSFKSERPLCFLLRHRQGPSQRGRMDLPTPRRLPSPHLVDLKFMNTISAAHHIGSTCFRHDGIELGSDNTRITAKHRPLRKQDIGRRASGQKDCLSNVPTNLNIPPLLKLIFWMSFFLSYRPRLPDFVFGRRR